MRIRFCEGRLLVIFEKVLVEVWVEGRLEEFK